MSALWMRAVVGDHALEVGAVQGEQLALLDRDGGGGAGLVVEERHLPEEVAGAEHGEDDLPPVVAQDRDLDAPLQDHEEEVAFLVLEEDHRVLGVAPPRGHPGQAGDVLVAELREDRDRPQELPLVHPWRPPRRMVPDQEPTEAGHAARSTSTASWPADRPPGLEGPLRGEVHEARPHDADGRVVVQVGAGHVGGGGPGRGPGPEEVEHPRRRPREIAPAHDGPGLEGVVRVDVHDVEGQDARRCARGPRSPRCRSPPWARGSAAARAAGPSPRGGRPGRPG